MLSFLHCNKKGCFHVLLKVPIINYTVKNIDVPVQTLHWIPPSLPHPWLPPHLPPRPRLNLHAPAWWTLDHLKETRKKWTHGVQWTSLEPRLLSFEFQIRFEVEMHIFLLAYISSPLLNFSGMSQMSQMALSGYSWFHRLRYHWNTVFWSIKLYSPLLSTKMTPLEWLVVVGWVWGCEEGWSLVAGPSTSSSMSSSDTRNWGSGAVMEDGSYHITRGSVNTHTICYILDCMVLWCVVLCWLYVYMHDYKIWL